MTEDSPSATNYLLRYLPLPDVSAGMVLGAPLVIAEKGVISFNLPAGHVLTDSNIQQMRVRQAEFVCIQEIDTRDDAGRADARALAEARLQRIFRAADLRQPAMAGLYRAVRAYRRT